MKTRNDILPNDPEKLTQLIQSQSIIRMMIDDAGNFGNQAASFNLILRIRELGFKGEFEVIYFTGAKEKILQLFDLPLVENNIFYSPNYGIKFIDLPEFSRQSHENNVKPIALGLTGAVDKNPTDWKLGITNDNFANFLNVDIFLRLSPYYNMDDICDTRIYLRHAEQPIIQNNSCNQILITPVATLEHAHNYLHYTNDGQSLLDQHPALDTLLSHIENQSINFQPVYGWTLRESPSNLLNIILGSRYAQMHGGSNFQKPLVIGAFFDLETENEFFSLNGMQASNLQLLTQLIFTDDWSKYDEFSGAEKVKQSIRALKLRSAFHTAKLADVNVIDQINQLKSQEILLLSFPSLPKTVFDGLYTHHASNIFPPVREGASSLTSLITTTGKPHIHCRSQMDWEINLDKANEHLQEQLTNLNSLICKEMYGLALDFTAWSQHSLDKMTGNFIIDAYDSNSELSQYFMQLKDDALKPENDRIGNDLLTASNLLDNMSWLCDKILETAVTYAASVVNECPGYFPKALPNQKQTHNKINYLNAHDMTLFSSRHIPAIPSANTSCIGFIL